MGRCAGAVNVPWCSHMVDLDRKPSTELADAPRQTWNLPDCSGSDWLQPTDLATDLSRPCGEGSFGSIAICNCTKNGFPETVARKSIPLQDVDRYDTGWQVVAEIRHLRASGGRASPNRHSGVISYFGSWLEPNSEIVLVTELCTESLANLVRNNGPYEVEYARYVVASMLEVLRHLHKVVQIVHRDIKSENVVVDAQNRPKLIDFGCAMAKDGSDHLENGNSETNGAGSPAYNAPEVLRQEAVLDCAESSDLWALSVMSYHMLTGDLPFKGGGMIMKIWEQIAKAEYSWPVTPVDQEAQRFIEQVLVVDLNQRLGCCGRSSTEDTQREGDVDYQVVMAHPMFGIYHHIQDWSDLPVATVHYNTPMLQERCSEAAPTPKSPSVDPGVITYKDLSELDYQTNLHQGFLERNERIIFTGPLSKHIPWRLTREREFSLVVKVKPEGPSTGDRASVQLKRDQEPVQIQSARIIYIHSENWKKMGDIPLMHDTCAMASNDRDFQVVTKNRVYVLEDKTDKATQWAHHIAMVVKQIYGDRATHCPGTPHEHRVQTDESNCCCSLM